MKDEQREANITELNKKFKNFEVIAYDEDGRVLQRAIIKAISSLEANKKIPQVDNATSYFVKSID